MAVGAAGYEVELNGSIHKATAIKDVYNKVIGWSCTISDLTPDTNYSYRVRSTNAGGTGPYTSGYYSVRTMLNTPTGLKAASVTTTSIKLQWDEVKGADSYNLTFNGALHTVTDSVASKEFTDPDPGIKYSYNIKAKNSYVESGAASGSTMTLSEPPTNITVAKTATAVTIRWNMAVGATGYEVEFNGSIHKATAIKDVYNVITGWSCTISDLTPDTDYSYRVQSDKNGKYPDDHPVKFTVNICNHRYGRCTMECRNRSHQL